MKPIVTPDEMRAIDAEATRTTPVDELIERAGAATARAALRMLGGAYGRRVVVIAGPGNNGRDGLVAARRLRNRGVQVTVFAADSVPDRLPAADLVVDAAYGTGFRGEWTAPDVGSARVLAVDIPSGVDGSTGRAGPRVLAADRTVTFAALKPGLVLQPGRALAGDVEVADIGLPVQSAHAHLVEAADVACWIPRRRVDAHKWHAGVFAVAGSPGMTGAAHLASRAALRAGAGIVHLVSPGVTLDPGAPVEVVRRSLDPFDWSTEVLGSLPRFRSLLVGPGLGRAEPTAAQARRVIVDAELPTVVDGDGLFALGWSAEGGVGAIRSRRAPTVLTPHDGEYTLLMGEAPGADRFVAVRRLAVDTRAVVVLKGPTTLVARPDGHVRAITEGDARLATAGTGDVLAGIIAALLARGVETFDAASAAVWLHGRAASLGPTEGLLAGDLPDLLPDAVRSLGESDGRRP